MDRILAWIVRRLCFLLLLAVVGGAVLVFSGWSHIGQIHEFKASGIEATATIEGATRSRGRRSGEFYSLKLVWRDAKGAIQSYDSVSISNEFARQIIIDNTIRRERVRIKYVPETKVMPIVLDDVHRQYRGVGEEDAEYRIWLGAVISAVGVVGYGLMVLLGRLWRKAVASPQA